MCSIFNRLRTMLASVVRSIFDKDICIFLKVIVDTKSQMNRRIHEGQITKLLLLKYKIVIL